MHADELINRIATGADPIRGRNCRATVDGTRSGSARERRAGAGERPTGHRTGARSRAGLRRRGRDGTSGRAPRATLEPTGWAHADDETADDAGEITIYYQPQIAIATGEVVGVEALLRWRHPRPRHGRPGGLIRVAEHDPGDAAAHRRVLRRRDRPARRLAAAGPPLRAAVNVSVRDLHSGDIADRSPTCWPATPSRPTCCSWRSPRAR